MNTTEQNLTPRQNRMIQSLLQSSSVKSACRSARVSRTTFYEWMKDDSFKKALRDAESELIESESIALLAVMEGCRMILFRLATTAESENQKRLSALNLYELALKLRENYQIESRLQILEDIENERQAKAKQTGRR